MARRAQLALRQVAVWQAAAQATAQLQTAQEQAAAKAAQQSDKVAHLLLEIGPAPNLQVLQNAFVLAGPTAHVTADMQHVHKQQADCDLQV